MSTDRPNLAAAFTPTRRRAAATDTIPGPGIAVTPSTPRVVGGVAGDVHNVAVYLPVALRDLVRERAHQRGLSITELVEEAFAQHGANYYELNAAPVHRPGSMPTRSTPRRGHGTIQIQLRLDDSQHQWLDGQVQRHGAPSRSALVTAALTRHLSPER